jgi:hypothetical protein
MSLYAVSIFLAAFLLFQVQPLIAKYILPWYGGSPAVWTTCMLFFQALLLAGYAYSHSLSGMLSRTRQGKLHALLMGLAGLTFLLQILTWGTPLLPGVDWRPVGAVGPILGILWLLSLGIGVPYLLLASTSPLLQRWYSIDYPGRSPYRLFSLSNLGSLLALLTFPVLFEPFLDLRTHAWVWLGLFILFGLGCAGCALRKREASGDPGRGGGSAGSAEAAEPRPARADVAATALWFAPATCASILLLAVTNHLCQEVAVIPFLWILPLSVYLISFVLCFDRQSWYSRQWYLPLFLAATVAAWMALFAAGDVGIRTEIAVFVALLFLGCMICHGELYRLRPHPRLLTSFYLTVAAGGATGGFFVSILAPNLFSGYWELPLGMLLTWVLAGVVFARERRSGLPEGFRWCAYGFVVVFMTLTAKRLEGVLPGVDGIGKVWGAPLGTVLLGGALIAGALIVLSRLPAGGRLHLRSPLWPRVTLASAVLSQVVVTGTLIAVDRRDALERTRGFYGTLKVAELAEGERTRDRIRTLTHGRTIHGLQSLDAERRRLPTAYYGPRSGVGLVLRDDSDGPSLRRSGDPWRIGVVGLGIGTLAAYGRPGDVLRFYEINSDVVRIARDEGYFYFLSDSPATVELSLGDARLSLEAELRERGSWGFNLLALDAFSGDAIPVHLLTREAMGVYLAHLRPEGLLALHISNRYLDLRPLVASLADDFELHARWVHAHTGGDELQRPSSWVLLADTESAFAELDPFLPFDARDDPDRRVPSWTDNFSNLLQVIR